MPKTQYFSKILLFGEHIVIKGAQALAIPFSTFYGKWQYDLKKKHNFSALQPFATHIQTLEQLHYPINSSKFLKDISKGLYFDSTIPIGYGLGSSGALCAAVLDTYGEVPVHSPLNHIQAELARLEHFFHGSSSGTDPLICYLQQALLIDNQTYKTVQLPKYSLQQNHHFFLINTFLPRKTATYVNHFLELCENTYFLKRCEQELIPDNNDAIDSFLQSDWTSLFEMIHQISWFEYRYFAEMIPDDFKNVWLAGLSSDTYKLKLCGAGGGGFILGYANNLNTIKELEKQYEVTYVNW